MSKASIRSRTPRAGQGIINFRNSKSRSFRRASLVGDLQERFSNGEPVSIRIDNVEDYQVAPPPEQTSKMSSGLKVGPDTHSTSQFEVLRRSDPQKAHARARSVPF